MKKEWNIAINDTTCKVSYFCEQKQLNPKLFVDGVMIPFPNNKKSFILGHDFPIVICGKECRFVSAFNGADLVIDGYFVDGQKPYSPLRIPLWCWIFIILSVLLPIVAIGGFLPAALAGLSVIMCIKFSATPFLKLRTKIWYCILYVAMVWLLFGLLLFSLSL